MDMQLPHDVAERARIDLGAAGHVLQRLRHHVGLEGQHGLVERRQVVDLLDARPLRHQHQPRPAAVVHQPEFAQPKPHDWFAVASSRWSSANPALRPGSMGCFLLCFSEARAPARCLQAIHRPADGQAPSMQIRLRPCICEPNCRYGRREVGGGRSTRQPGQVRKEAALTSPERVIVPASRLFRQHRSAAAALTASRAAGETRPGDGRWLPEGRTDKTGG